MKWSDTRRVSLSALAVSAGVLLLLCWRFLQAGRNTPQRTANVPLAWGESYPRPQFLVSGHKRLSEPLPSSLHGVGKGPLLWV